MNQVELNLNHFSAFEDESLVRVVCYFQEQTVNLNKTAQWKGLIAPTLDGNELWLVESEQQSVLENKMGFHKPLKAVSEFSNVEMEKFFQKK